MSDPGASDSPTPPPGLRIHAAVFAASAVFIWLMLINDDCHDAYTHFFVAQRIAAGQMPYRDFFMHILPAPGIILAAWFKVFGDGMAGLRILLALSGATATAVAFDISALLIKGPLRWIGPLGVLSTFIIGNEGISHMVFAVPAALIATALAIRTDRSGSLRLWFACGVLISLSACCTHTIGAWLGAGMVVAALTANAPIRSRLASSLILCTGMAAPMILLLTWLAAYGAMNDFIYDIFIWAIDRYAPFHAGLGWGAWLPPWSMLSGIPLPWRPVWISALAVTWSAVWVLPLVPLLALWPNRRLQIDGRRVLAFSAAALLLSSFPHAGAMRVVRLTGPAWILLGVELYRHFWPAIPTKNRSAVWSIVVAALSVFLLLGTGLQWSYRDQLVWLETTRGRVLVRTDTKGEFEMLRRHFPPGARVFALPDSGSALYFAQIVNPVKNDYGLVPVLFAPATLQEGIASLTEQGYPPLVILPHPANDVQDIIRTFNPSKHLEEFQSNPWNEFINEHYKLAFRDGPALGFVKK